MRPLGLSRQELWSAGPDRLSGGNGRARRRCAWGSWGGPGRGRVQICCKGVPGREKRRMKARNINGSSREPRLDPGLCNRFGQTAPPRTPARTAAAAITPTPGRRDAHFALERALLTAHLEGEMHISTSTGPTRPHHPGRPRPHRPAPAPVHGPRLPARKALYDSGALARKRSRSRVASHTDLVRARRGSDPGPARDRSCPAAKEGRP